VVLDYRGKPADFDGAGNGERGELDGVRRRAQCAAAESGDGCRRSRLPGFRRRWQWVAGSGGGQIVPGLAGGRHDPPLELSID